MSARIPPQPGPDDPTARAEDPRDGAEIFSSEAGRGLEEFFRPLLAIAEFTEDGVSHLLEVRKVLEAEAAWLAALRAEEHHLSALRKDLAVMERAVEAGGAVDAADAGFHLHVAEASGNPLLERIMDGIFAVLDELVRPGRQEMVSADDKRQSFVEQHREVLEGLEARDPERARQAMYVHLALVERESGGS